MYNAIRLALLCPEFRYFSDRGNQHGMFFFFCLPNVSKSMHARYGYSRTREKGTLINLVPSFRESSMYQADSVCFFTQL